MWRGDSQPVGMNNLTVWLADTMILLCSFTLAAHQSPVPDRAARGNLVDVMLQLTAICMKVKLVQFCLWQTASNANPHRALRTAHLGVATLPC